jgi:GntR family transcriptional regulator, carbon starvation induced regulator
MRPAKVEPLSRTATSNVYAQLHREIVIGGILPGARLRIEELRDRYGVGSSPIREALNRLSAEGLVIAQDQKGFRVADVSLDDLRELTRTRCLINQISVPEAIANGDQAWEETIVLEFHRLSRIKTQLGDAETQESWDRQHRIFHDALIAACGSRWLRQFAGKLFDYAERYRKLSNALAVFPGRDAEAEHRAIMEAMINRQSETAVELLNAHAMKTANIIEIHFGKSLVSSELSDNAETASKHEDGAVEPRRLSK